MGKVANQRTVKVSKQACDKNNNYATINLDALEKASKDLNGVAFKLWIFFSRNQKDYEVDMWVGNLEKFGIPKGGSYNRAWEELEKKGYLVLENGKTRYAFNEIPLVTEMVINESLVTKTDMDSYQNGKRIVTKTEPIVTKTVRENITYTTNNNTINNTESDSFADAKPVQGKSIDTCTNKKDKATLSQHDIYNFIQANYTDKLNNKYLDKCFDGFDLDILLGIFKYNSNQYEWLDGENSYTDEKSRFTTHLNYIKNKLYDAEVEEWKVIEQQREADINRRFKQIEDDNIIVYFNEESKFSKNQSHNSNKEDNGIDIVSYVSKQKEKHSNNEYALAGIEYCCRGKELDKITKSQAIALKKEIDDCIVEATLPF